ncbi:succinate dehydrogenase [ubiquinone] cytochrome b small subunit B, mitochondrial-like [Watersipora subatra]|uniref:succinate dehydrogenase [ubiquinone] cytochrome b small subunit B, mitochondrial-like n=1 Tax=Watersipora subatra TaxID=2589382 RepID=UPI00355B2143
MASLARLLTKGFTKTLTTESRSIFIPRNLSPSSQNAFIVPDRRVHLTPLRQQEAVVSAEGSHGGRWVMERVVAGSLYAVIPAAYLMEPSFAMDTALSSFIILHAHWGMASIFSDYMHGYPSITGERRHPVLTTMAKVIPYVLSILAFACLMNFNYNDVGLVKAISMLWRV